jgi:hypothetical protein
LAEATEHIHAELVDDVEHIRYCFCYFLLELCHNFEYIIVAENFLHPHDSFPINQEDVPLIWREQTIDVIFIQSQRL